jgi:hypothetical protein
MLKRRRGDILILGGTFRACPNHGTIVDSARQRRVALAMPVSDARTSDSTGKDSCARREVAGTPTGCHGLARAFSERFLPPGMATAADTRTGAGTAEAFPAVPCRKPWRERTRASPCHPPRTSLARDFRRSVLDVLPIAAARGDGAPFLPPMGLPTQSAESLAWWDFGRGRARRGV